jgi:hypothetical protein
MAWSEAEIPLQRGWMTVTPNKRDGTPGRMINVRKLAALDIALHGSRFILAEFGGGVLLCLALGLWLIYASFPVGQDTAMLRLVTEVYLLFLAINYVPLLVYAILIARRKSARQEVAAELADKGRYARKYGLQQLFLVAPLIIPVLALVQEVQARRKSLSIGSDR